MEQVASTLNRRDIVLMKMNKKTFKIKNVVFDKYFVIYDNELYEDFGSYRVPVSMDHIIKQKFSENIIDIQWEEIDE